MFLLNVGINNLAFTVSMDLKFKTGRIMVGGKREGYGDHIFSKNRNENLKRHQLKEEK